MIGMIPHATPVLCVIRFIELSHVFQARKGEAVPLTLMNIALALAVVILLILIVMKVFRATIIEVKEHRHSKRRSDELSEILSRFGITTSGRGTGVEDTLEEKGTKDPH